MLAAYAQSQSADDPLSGLEVGERPDPEVPDGWVRVHLRTSALNHHDVWSLRGVGLPADRLPMVLGCDGAGTTDDGDEVLVHAVVASPGWVGDETLDPRRSLLSEVYDGTLAETVVVPRYNLVAKPAELSWEHAACLPTVSKSNRCNSQRTGPRTDRCRCLAVRSRRSRLTSSGSAASASGRSTRALSTW